MTDLIESTAELVGRAEAKLAARVRRLYRGADADAVQKDAAAKFGIVERTSRRMLKQSADLGAALEALRQRSPHGTFGDRLRVLGITEMTASRLRRLALYREVLPPTPPAALGITSWTDGSALEFGRALLDMASDPVPQGADPIQVATAKLAKKKHARRGVALATAVAKLEAELSVALHEGDLGAATALDMWLSAGKRLDQAGRQLARG